jgi:hypothetical protein
MEKYIENINIPDNIKSIKIDIGLSYGANQSNVWFENDKNEELFVFGFEPNPDCLSVLYTGNIQVQHPAHPSAIADKYLKSRFAILPVALSNFKEEKTLDFFMMQRDCGTSSLYTPVDPFIGPVKEVVKIPVFSLKHFFDAFKWWDRFPYIEYIKIDAQGSDFDIILGAEHYLKERVVYITAEPEIYQYSGCGHNSEYNMTSYMESIGFERVYHPNTHDPTYINKKFLHLKESIYIYQRG